MALSAIGTVHVVAASMGLATGVTQLIRTRGDTFHRRLGYVYVGAMTISNGTALAIYEFTGAFNIFHSLAVYSLFSIGMALRPMLVKPRPYQWYRMHYMWMSYSYAGLSAAAATEFLLRVVHMAGWTSAVVGTIPVMAIGSVLIFKFAPPLRAAQK
jgi:uncharacterized membrane protein